jgi:hypothetical protein
MVRLSLCDGFAGALAMNFALVSSVVDMSTDSLAGVNQIVGQTVNAPQG